MKENTSHSGVPYWRYLLFLLLATLLVSFGPAIVMEASVHYPDMYSYKEAKDGVFDMENRSMKDRWWVSPSGEWEFYANRWIETDNDAAPRDAILPYGKSWEEIGYPLEGYASLKLSIINAVPGDEITMDRIMVFAAANFYLNGTLVAHSGIPSKNKDESKDIGNTQVDGYATVPADGKVTLIAEIGYSNTGAIGFKPVLFINKTTAMAYQDSRQFRTIFNNYLPIVAIITLVMMIGIGMTLLLVSKKRGLSPSFLYLLIAMFAYDIFSSDQGFFFVINGLYVSNTIMARLNFVFAAFLLCAIFYYLFRMGSTPLKKEKDFLKVFLPFSALEISLGIASAILYGGKASLICSLFQWAIALPLVLFAAYYASRKKPRSLAPFIISSLLLNLLVSEWLDFQELLVWDLVCVPSIGLSLVAIVGIIVFFRRDLELQKQFAQEAELQERYRISQEEALKGQIKPHFIFNCLSAIESSYHKNVEDGDHAMSLFAQHLRSDIDTMEVSLIPFEDEIKNIERYLELENLRLEKPYTLLYDIEVSDFALPPLSLQPFVENAIKYSKANEKENGFISLETRQFGEEIVLSIEDNGVGFDPNAIKATSQGLKNVKERLSLILGAEVQIVSAPNQGSKIQIRFAKKKINVKDN
jgi:two-component system, LytTR family, sensor kinase